MPRSPNPTHHVFAYGTLIFPEVARTLAPDLPDACPAELSGYVRAEATLRETANFPFVEPLSRDSRADSPDPVDGVLYRDLSLRQLEIFDWFEDEGTLYHRRSTNRLQVAEDGTWRPFAEPVWLYVLGRELKRLMCRYAGRSPEHFRQLPRKHWSPEGFRSNSLAEYYERTVVPAVQSESYRARFGEPSHENIRRFGRRLGLT